jgi:hypothetical protein
MIALLPPESLLLRLLGRRLHPRRERGVEAVQALVTDVHAAPREPEELESVLRDGHARPRRCASGYRRPGSARLRGRRRGTPFLEQGAPRSRLKGNEIGLIRGGDGGPASRRGRARSCSCRRVDPAARRAGTRPWARSRRADGGCSVPGTRSGDASRWTCTTAPSSVWSPSACACGSPSVASQPAVTARSSTPWSTPPSTRSPRRGRAAPDRPRPAAQLPRRRAGSRAREPHTEQRPAPAPSPTRPTSCPST